MNTEFHDAFRQYVQRKPNGQVGVALKAPLHGETVL
jgi:hypothetical protein